MLWLQQTLSVAHEVFWPLGTTLTAPPHASQVDMSILNTRFRRCAFMPSGAAHGGMLLHRRSLVAGYLAFGALASLRWRYQGPVFAVRLMRHPDKHAMKACQIGSRSGYQSCQARNKVQRFENDVGSAITVRCLQPVVNIAARCQRQAPFRNGWSAAGAIVSKRLSALYPCRAM